jgi:hypothetical protein
MGAGSDIILDFEQGTDLIDVSGIDADADAAGNQQFDFIEGDDFTAAGQLRYENVNGRTILYGNTDADLQAEFRVVIDGTFDPTDADFIL